MGIFNKNDEETKQQASSTIISDGVFIKGSLETTGSIFINGKVDGNAVVGETLTIGKTGEFIGDITCKNLVVNGTIDGIVSSENIHILEIGKIHGNIQYDNLEIEKNGIFEGQGKRRNSKFKSKYTEVTYTNKKLDDIIIENDTIKEVIEN
jgi:cytoskeletal protein CcmA (bactofilin family)